MFIWNSHRELTTKTMYQMTTRVKRFKTEWKSQFTNTVTVIDFEPEARINKSGKKTKIK